MMRVCILIAGIALVSADMPDGLSICDEYFFGQQAKIAKPPFCVNGGYCKASWIRNPEYPCECLDGFEGPHCEFTENTLPDRCSLGCRNGGTCKLGAPSWQHFYRGAEDRSSHGVTWTNPLDLQHCDCPDGYSGLLCEQPGMPCGSERCHNGGTCVETSNPNGSTDYHCDCTTADTHNGIVSFAGEFCEHEATSFCNEEPDQNGQQFCVNGGTCKSESHLGCECQTGYVGPLCEFEDNGDPPPECTLSCENHGICRKGAKDTSILEKYGLHHRRSLQQAYDENFEHCVCPRGYVGLQCEFQLDLCPGGAHACLNGGECVTVAEGTEISYACNCGGAETEHNRFAGRYCEMESTQFCTLDGGKSVQGAGVNSFCTNGGKCLANVPYNEPHPGCDCPRGFDGPNCQYALTTDLNHAATTFAAVLAFIVVVAVAIYFYIQRKKGFKRVDTSMPPTLDLIARSLGTDIRMAEFTEGPVSDTTEPATPPQKHTVSANSVAVRNPEDLYAARRTRWPRHARQRVPSSPIPMFDDMDYEEEEIQFSRKKYWPNDAHNDATNPIQIFDDISVNSDSYRGGSDGSQDYSDEDNHRIT